MVKKLEVYKEIQNFGNASVNGINYVDAINPNSPNTNGMSSSQAISALSSMYGYVDNLANIGGKSLPFANTVAIGSNAYSLGATATSEKPYITTNDLLGLSSALLGAAAVGIAATATAPAWVPVAIGAAALAAGAAGTQYKEKIDLGDLSDNISNDLNKIQEKLKETINQAAEKMGETAENFSNAIDKIWDKAQELGERFGDWLREKFDDIGDWFDQAQKDFGEWFIPLAKDLGDWLGLNRDGKYHIYDPLVLDLDGDGIETVGTQGYAGALFDHDKDGIRTSTGWAAADDGLLVIDRNSDSLINNGGELFGDSTVLKDGSNAAHGYAALAEFDTNSDGKVDAQDADFDKLKVWRDLNQDGVSQEGELFTLAELNIQSLDTAYQDVNTRLGNGNTVAQKGSYTLADGTTREAGDLLLAADHLHSRFTDSVKLTEEQMQAANLQGIGRLCEAAALSSRLAA